MGSSKSCLIDIQVMAKSLQELQGQCVGRLAQKYTICHRLYPTNCVLVYDIFSGSCVVMPSMSA